MSRDGCSTRRSRNSLLALVLAIAAFAPGFSVAARADDLTSADSAAATSLYEPAVDTTASPGHSTTDPSAKGATADAVRPVAAPSSSASAAAPVSPPRTSPASSSTNPATVMVPDSMPEPPYIKPGNPPYVPSTAIIPPATPSQTFNSDSLDSGGGDSQIIDYESQGGMRPPSVNSPQDFISDGDDISALGIELREARRKLVGGAEAEGLLIVDVAGGSPAAAAGLRANKHTAHDVVEGAIAVGAVLFPPAIVAVAALEQLPFGESYDLIIGVDGTRVTNLLDFEDRMRDVRAGEIVYLSIDRNGTRIQIPVQLPRTLPPPTF